MNVVINPKMSLFGLVDHINKRRLFANYRGSLVTISHEIENSVLNIGAQGRLFSGFQKMSFFLPQVNRYRRLALIAEHIWVFGIPDCTLPVIDNVSYVPLAEGDAMTREWFLVADAPEYFSALVAQDLSGFDVPDKQRVFRGIWTFDAAMVEQLHTAVAEMVGISPHLGQTRDYSRQFNQISATAESLINALETRNAELTRAQTLRDDLTDMLVHDLRNPLSAVIVSLDLIARTAKNGDTVLLERLIEGARSGGNELRAMISDILDINRIQAGELRLKREKVSVADLFGEIVGRYGAVAQLEGKKLIVRGDLSEAVVYGNRDHLLRALANLVTNALKYTSTDGLIVLSCAFEPLTQSLQIIVSDNGLGMPADQQAIIFDKYKQVTGRGDERRGFGLGLTFCRMTVEAQGGTIRVESEEGQGSRFIITLRQAKE